MYTPFCVFWTHIACQQVCCTHLSRVSKCVVDASGGRLALRARCRQLVAAFPSAGVLLTPLSRQQMCFGVSRCVVHISRFPVSVVYTPLACQQVCRRRRMRTRCSSCTLSTAPRLSCVSRCVVHAVFTSACVLWKLIPCQQVCCTLCSVNFAWCVNFGQST